MTTRRNFFRRALGAVAAASVPVKVAAEEPAPEAVRLLEELPAVRAAWDAQDEILDPRRRMWEAQSSGTSRRCDE